MKNTISRPKLNLSTQRIASRLVLTFVVGLLFGLAMFPFLQVAKPNESYGQKVALGGDNMYRMVALWGIFTFIATLVTFWNKRFRMVSVLLICCWIVSIAFIGFLKFDDRTKLSCARSTPYSIDREFNRALDLIAQRMRLDEEPGTYLDNAYNYRNCINIRYLDGNEKDRIEGLFFSEDPKLQEMGILVNSDYKSFDDLTIATILVHELTHAGQYIYTVANNQKQDCFRQEAEAFTSQAIFLSQLNQEEQRSIYARISENQDANPTFKILLGIRDIQSQAYNSCDTLRQDNELNESQFSECVWTGVTNKVERVLKESPTYQEQCSVASRQAD